MAVAYVRNVALAALAAVISPAARGGCYNLVDRERTSIDGYYRMLLSVFAERQRDMRSVTLPFAIGCSLGAVSTYVSNVLGRSRPLWHPSLYEVQSVSYDLDFRADRVAELLASSGLTVATRDAGLDELRAWARMPSDLLDSPARPPAAPLTE